MIYWSLFIVITFNGLSAPDSAYLPITSFNNRLDCENAKNSNNSLIAQFNSTAIYLKCLKTDEAVINELLLLKPVE